MTVTKKDKIQRIGVLGGTFDPPHLGHLLLGESAREQLSLELVLFLPAGEPPHKSGNHTTAADHRLAMTTLAIADNPYFEVNTIDMDRPLPHHTASLYPLVRRAYPESELWLLMGGDSLRDLPTWHQPQRIVTEWRLGVLPRPEASIHWQALEEAIPGVKEAVQILDGATVSASSTDIRRWAAHRRSLRYLLPDAVADYVHANNLYGNIPQNYSSPPDTSSSGGTA